MSTPLAERMRPKSLEEFASQKHLLGDQAPLRQMLKSGHLASMIFWGPPGVGKTTLAELLAKETKRTFFALSAISSGIKEVREVIQRAKEKSLFIGEKAPILFIDEIHRFNKTQQDSLLAAVEKGWVTLIGATTENPSFEVVSALLSRCQVYILNALEKSDMASLLARAIKEDVLLQKRNIILKESDALIRFAGGDARKLLNGLELVVNAQVGKDVVVENASTLSCIQQNMAAFDKSGEQHYNLVSALIKSIRGSDPNAAVYWLMRMLEGGEEPKFIARRLLILASEDIGNANPTALILAQSTFESVQVLGLPECAIPMSQCAIYLANSPKSNSTYAAMRKAQQLISETGSLAVPMHLRNAPTSLMKNLDYGKGYAYSHDYEGNFTAQEYLPKELAATKFFEPGSNSRENQDRKLLQQRWGKKYDY